MPGSNVANAAVARSHGCDGCDWTLVIDCDRNFTNDPEWISCNAARCPGGQLFRLYLQRPEGSRPDFIDVICITPTRRIVTAADLAIDAERYLTNLAPPASAIGVQPDGRAVTGLATFFYAEGRTSDRRTLDVDTAAGPARLTIDIAPGEFRWTFGDGAACTAPTPGGRYDGDATERCDTRVAHVYRTATTAAVTLRAVWRGEYSFDVGYGAVGPRPIPGNGVTAPVTARDIRVGEARAELVGG